MPSFAILKDTSKLYRSSIGCADGLQSLMVTCSSTDTSLVKFFKKIRWAFYAKLLPTDKQTETDAAYKQNFLTQLVTISTCIIIQLLIKLSSVEW